jgi:hypothetical protein
LIEEFITQIPIESILVYFDADIFFYQSFSRIDNLFIENDVILSKHLFPPALAGSEIYGKYNGGLIFFKNSKKSLNYLSTWRQLCIDWCELKIDRNRFADQKYLERFEFNSGVYALVDPGINLGQQYFVDRKIKIKKLNTNILMVDGFQLIAFHFHGFKIGKYFFNTGFNRYAPLKNRIKIFLFIYRPYIGSIRRELRQLKQNIQLDSESILYRDPHFRFYRLIFQVLKFSKVISFGKN